MAGEAGSGVAGMGLVWHGRPGGARLGSAGRGRRGGASGAAWPGTAGMARPDEAMYGKVRQARSG
jgi:hypothetical protein